MLRGRAADVVLGGGAAYVCLRVWHSFRASAGVSATRARGMATMAPGDAENKQPPFVFTSANFSQPKLPPNLEVIDVPLLEPTPEALASVGGRLISGPDEVSCANKNFEIVKWPVSGWRALDPDTGDEAGTTEGPFEVHWSGDYFFGHNLAVATSNNFYLDGLAARPEVAALDGPGTTDGGHLWMSDYHPDGGQLFWPERPIPFVVRSFCDVTFALLVLWRFPRRFSVRVLNSPFVTLDSK